MKIFGIPVLRLAGEQACSKFIPAEQLDKWIEQHNQWRGARGLAAQIIHNARRERRELLRASRQQAALEQEREIIELRALLQQDTQSAVKEAVVWLAEEQHIEQVITADLQRKAIGWAVDTIRQWGAELDWDGLIVKRIAEIARQQLGESSITLYVNPDRIENIKAALPGSISWRVEGDENLTSRQALLENSLLRISVDLETQFELLLQQFGDFVTAGGGVKNGNE